MLMNSDSVMMASNSHGSTRYGKPNPIMEMCFELDICPDLILAAIALFGALAFAYLYTKITKAGRRRRRRDAELSGDFLDPMNLFNDKLWTGTHSQHANLLSS